MSEEDYVTRPAKQAKYDDESEIDHINMLPDDILSSVVSCLKVRDIVNTSLVSRRWRYLCAPMSTLGFNCFNMFGDDAATATATAGSQQCPCSHYKDRFVRGVNQFLQFFKGSKLDMFWVGYCVDQDSSHDIDQWVRFALSKDVNRLYISLSCYKLRKLLGYQKRNTELYTLKTDLFSESKLLGLGLCSCLLGPGVIHQFSTLRGMFLIKVPLGTVEIETIKSSCSNLEEMQFMHCPLPSKLCISQLARLRCLLVHSCEGVEEIEISLMATLTRFEYAGSRVKFSVSGVSNLKSIYVTAHDETCIRYFFDQLGKDFAVVETLYLYSKTSWVSYTPNKLTPFENVTKLKFLCCRRKDIFDGPKMILIINSCPLLEKLHMVRAPVSSAVAMDMHTKYVHKHLKKVRLGGFHSRPDDYIDFALYMMEYAVGLHRMIIDPEHDIYNGPETPSIELEKWRNEEREEVRARLKDCPKKVSLVIL